MRVRHQAAPHFVRINFVGVAGFEPATSCSQSRRDDRATLHPEIGSNIKVTAALTNLYKNVNLQFEMIWLLLRKTKPF